MKIEVFKYSLQDVPFKEWDDFIWSSRNGTIFHTATFYKYHDEPKDVHFNTFKYKNEVIAELVAYEDDDFFKSPFAASYGGFAFKKDLRFKHIEAVLLNCFEHIGSNKTIQFVLAPHPYDVYQDETQDFLLKYSGFEETETLYSSTVDLNTFDDTKVDFKTIQRIQKAQKDGVYVQSLPLDRLEDYYQILESNKKKFDQKPTHSLSELKKLVDLFPEKILCYGLFFKDELIGGAINFVATNHLVLSFYIALNYEHKELGGIPVLIYEFIRDAKARGFRYLDIGVSMETDTNNPMDPRRSLIYFKEHFGAKGYCRRKYIKKGSSLLKE